MDKSTEAIFWLKEFSKSWVNIISDEVVYQEQVSESESGQVIWFNGWTTYIKEYLSGKFWLEILFKIRRFGNLEYYTALIEAYEPIHKEKFIRARQTSGDSNLGCTGEDDTMFVNVVNPREKPQRMTVPLPIRSIIRLNSFDFSSDVLTEVFKPADEFTTFLNVDWEDGVISSLSGDSPSDVIKGGAQPVNDLTYQKPPSRRELSREIRNEDIASILRVYFDRTSVRLTCGEGLDFSVEDIKVFLCPVDSSEGASHLIHALSPCK